MPHRCDHHVSNVRPLASRASFLDSGKPARGRHHSLGSRPTGDGAGSPLRSEVSWLGMSSVAACFLAENGALEAQAMMSGSLCFQGSAGTPVRFIFQKWSGCGESNTGNPAPKAGDLPLAYTPKKNGAQLSALGSLAGLSRLGEELGSHPGV